MIRLNGRQFPELEKINRVFDDMTAHLTVHMNHEEFIIFPYIRKMVKHGRKVKSSIFRSVKSPIAVMVTDHETENECLKQLDYLTHHYTAPLEADNTFKVTYHALRDLEKDIHAHLEIENDVLFPKALEMEKRFNNLKYTHQTSADHILDVEQPKNQPATNVFESL